MKQQKNGECLSEESDNTALKDAYRGPRGSVRPGPSLMMQKSLRIQEEKERIRALLYQRRSMEESLKQSCLVLTRAALCLL